MPAGESGVSSSWRSWIGLHCYCSQSLSKTNGGLQFFTLQNGLLYNLFLGVLLVAKCAGAVAGQYPGRNLAQGYNNIVGVRYGSYSVTMLHQGGGFQI